jgi:hypothetical protein
LGNVTSEIKDYGLAPHLNITVLNSYDTQNNLLVRTMPEGDSISPLASPARMDGRWA